MLIVPTFHLYHLILLSLFVLFVYIHTHTCHNRNEYTTLFTTLTQSSSPLLPIDCSFIILLCSFICVLAGEQFRLILYAEVLSSSPPIFLSLHYTLRFFVDQLFNYRCYSQTHLYILATCSPFNSFKAYSLCLRMCYTHTQIVCTLSIENKWMCKVSCRPSLFVELHRINNIMHVPVSSFEPRHSFPLWLKRGENQTELFGWHVSLSLILYLCLYAVCRLSQCIALYTGIFSMNKQVHYVVWLGLRYHNKPNTAPNHEKWLNKVNASRLLCSPQF